MRKRHLSTIAAAAVVGVLAFAGSASAHNGGVSAGCNAGQPRAVANLTNYNGTNAITITNNGVELTPGTFGSSYVATLPLGDPFIVHTVVYKVTAHDDPSNANGWSPGGTLTVPACQTPPTTTAAPTTTTSTTSTTIAATTTTVAETTTTSAPAETTTTSADTTTTAAATTTSSTTPASVLATTTSTAAVCCPPVPPQGLPETGTTSWPLVLAAIGCTIGGGGAIRLARRRV